MFKKAMPVFMLAESPVHLGSGTELGLVDLPIQREKHTGFPKIESSGIKGCLREAFESPAVKEKLKSLIGNGSADNDRLEKLIEQVFGPEQGDLHSGALGFTDGRLIAFPVKSMKGVFAWITCPHVLERLRDELGLAGIKLPESPPKNTVTEQSGVIFDRDGEIRVVLEEYTFPVKKDASCSQLADWLAETMFKTGGGGGDLLAYWMEKMRNSLVVLTDDDFRDFVELSTEVVARTRIDADTGTVASGALFYEEYLPQESILYTLALAAPVYQKKDAKDAYFKQEGKDEATLVLELFRRGVPEVIQIGGNATIGKGLVRLSFPDREETMDCQAQSPDL